MCRRARFTIRRGPARGAALAALCLAASALVVASGDEGEGAPAPHWAFRPLLRAPAPAVDAGAWAAEPIDGFVLARLEAAGLKPSPEAERRTLIRRLSFDLAGLPPEPEDVEAWLADPSPDAFERLADRLLASPRFGERWGRHWLDVARYADTRGYVFTQEPRYAYSYTYRDYAIHAFNEDLPYDRFIHEQIAADQLDLGSDPRPLAALGFLTLGRRFMNNAHDVIDDRIDVVSRGLLGLTVSCARCHDHKYDPITQKDYYGLYGVFASSVEPRDLPLIEDPASSSDYESFRRELAERQDRADVYLREQTEALVARARARVADYLLAASKPPAGPEDGRGQALGKDDLRPRFIRRWRDHLEAKIEHGHPVLGLWKELSGLAAEGFAAKAAELLSARAAGGAPLNARVAEAFASAPASIEEASRRYGELFAAADRAWKEELEAIASSRASSERPSAAAPPPAVLADASLEELRQALYGSGGPFDLTGEDVRRFIDRDVRNRLRELENQVETLGVTHPFAPPRAMALVDAPSPEEPRIFQRGNPGRPGDTVPRQFLAVLAGKAQAPFTKGSGRLELARAITGTSGELAARVFVNRVWLHLLGAGLVRTPSDFGVRGEPPSHPELLDSLARRFIEDGWSMKRLLMRIVRSRTYRQASAPRREAAERDPENILLWRALPKRLEFEPLRDSLLAVSGDLDLAMGGRPVALFADASARRRSIYGFIDRQHLPGVLRDFDFANPDASCPQRHETIIPQQALFLMNGALAMERAARLAALEEIAAAGDDATRIARIYLRVFGRPPSAEDVDLGKRFIGGGGAGEAPALWERYVQALLMSNEFVFID
jgi:hypothetical protein